MPTHPPDPPDFAAARDRVLAELVRFVRRLRRAGAEVPANATLPATEALAEVGLDDRDHVRAALHAVLVANPHDSDAFDEQFPGFWTRLRAGLEATAADDDRPGERGDGRGGEHDDRDGGLAADVALTDSNGAGRDDEKDGADTGDGEREVRSRRIANVATDDDEDPADGGQSATYSAAGRATPVEEGAGTGDPLDRGAVQRFQAALATISGRRWSPSRDGESVDVRRALRDSLATGGVTVQVPTRERDRSAFQTCVLVDVSQSVLDAVDRGLLLAFLDALVADGRSVRVFFFDTDIRDVTDAFARQRGDPAAALARSEVTWGGGTQIGDSLATLRRQWPHAVDRRAATVVVSDGLDVGDVDELEGGMAWLARRSGAVVWLNPLAASPRYEPTCRGMAAALPYVDALFAFGGNDDLVEVARQLGRFGPHGPVGYQYDFRDRTTDHDDGSRRTDAPS